MNKPELRPASEGQRPSASEYNKLIKLVAGLCNSLHIQGYVDSTGFHTRRTPTKKVNRLAYCKDDAGAGIEIDCYLDTDLVGEQITVTCNIAQNGADLDDATPFLVTSDPIIVTEIDGVWYCTGLFNPSKECVCVEP